MENIIIGGHLAMESPLELYGERNSIPFFVSTNRTTPDLSGCLRHIDANPAGILPLKVILNRPLSLPAHPK